MFIKKKLQLLIFGLGAALILSACQPVASPLMGIFYNDTKYGDMVTSLDSGTKEGKACAKSFLGLVATGDASIQAAKNNGGITKVTHIDHSAKSTLGFDAEWCTIVRGE